MRGHNVIHGGGNQCFSHQCTSGCIKAIDDDHTMMSSGPQNNTYDTREFKAPYGSQNANGVVLWNILIFNQYIMNDALFQFKAFIGNIRASPRCLFCSEARKLSRHKCTCCRIGNSHFTYKKHIVPVRHLFLNQFDARFNTFDCLFPRHSRFFYKILCAHPQLMRTQSRDPAHIRINAHVDNFHMRTTIIG